MSTTFDVYEQSGQLIASVNEIEIDPGDAVRIVNKYAQPIEVKFCTDDSNGRTLSCAQELGPFPANEPTPDLLIPHANGELTINAIHVTAGPEYPKIMVRRRSSTGEG